MYRSLKSIIAIWTFICAGLFIYAVVSSFLKLSEGPAVTNASVTGWLLGSLFGMVVWFGIWFIPTAVIGVFAWTMKPDKTEVIEVQSPPPLPPNFPPYNPPPVKPIWLDKVFAKIMEYKAESAVISIILIIMYLVATR